MVEVKNARSLVAACVYPINEGIVSEVSKDVKFSIDSIIKGTYPHMEDILYEEYINRRTIYDRR